MPPYVAVRRSKEYGIIIPHLQLSVFKRLSANQLTLISRPTRQRVLQRMPLTGGRENTRKFIHENLQCQDARSRAQVDCG
jgi:hypothetical protein